LHLLAVIFNNFVWQAKPIEGSTGDDNAAVEEGDDNATEGEPVDDVCFLKN
jgi:hypothetical protein